MRFSVWLGLQPIITLDSYISFVLGMVLACGVIFQTPLVVLTLAKVGLVGSATLRRYRRHVIVAALLLGATLSPPDIFSQMALALPMWLLFEVGVILAHLLVFRRQREPLR